MVTVPGYQIHRLLNWGSQGDVFLATDDEGRKVALKVVTGDRVDGEARALDRLRREARLLRAISSPHVVGVRGFLESPEWSCLVLEYLEGQRLDVAVKQRCGAAPEPAFDAGASTVHLADGESPPAQATPQSRPVAEGMKTAEYVGWAERVARQLVRGVAELHAINLLHRDLKPQNAMLVDDRVVLIDFGFARMDGMTTMTQSGAAIGTLAFMSPEQFRGEPASKRSDVYGLGASLFLCLTGAPPIDVGAGNLRDMGRHRAAPRLRRRSPDVSRSFEAVVMRALQADPRDRYADAGEMLADLERCQRGEQVRMPFSPGRWWRHQGRRVLWATAAMLICALAILQFRGFDPDRIAKGLLADMASSPQAAVTQWEGLRDDEKPPVTAALNQRVGSDAERTHQVARLLHLGLLRVGECAKHRALLLPTDGTEGPVDPVFADFVALDAPRGLLVRPGRAWFLMVSEDPASVWSAGDPVVMQSLIGVPECGEQLPAEHSLRNLPAVGLVASLQPFALFAPGTVKLSALSGPPIPTVFRGSLRAGKYEVSEEAVQRLRDWLHGQHSSAERQECDFWLAHPDEPAAAAEAFWKLIDAAPAASTRMPALVTPWVAHRFATLIGCRLPSFVEWQRIASNSGNPLHGGQRDASIPVVPVDSTTTWDITDAGITHANSNVAEWTLARGGIRQPAVAIRDPNAGFVAAPAKLSFSRVLKWVSAPLQIAPGNDVPQGFRLCRTVVGGR